MAFHLNLQTETVSHGCSTASLLVPPETPIRDVFRRMKEERRGSVCVTHNDKLVGIFTERDALRLMAENHDMDGPIESVMTKNPTTVLESDSMETAIERMANGGHRRLPIVDSNGKSVGIVKVTEILHYLVEHFPEFVYNLPPRPDQTSTQREGA